MQLIRHSPEMMANFRNYAASLGPASVPEYQVVHKYIQVPRGCLPIRVAQFSNGENRPLHWAIFIQTSSSRGVGNFYEIAGNPQTGYYPQQVVNNRHPRWNRDERGSHLVGWVAPTFLETLEKHFSQIPIQAGQTWVIEALMGLDQQYICAVQMEYAQWFRQMGIVAEAWEVGDA